MLKPMMVLLIAAMACLPASAEKCDSEDFQVKSREVVRDLQRIDAPDGLQETYTETIGGISQWINVRGMSRDNPVILFLHGGPASPSMPSLWQFQRPVEEFFTVVHYDQRGAGKTYRTVDPESIGDTLHIERYVDDAIEVAEHVRERYGKEKMILAGHSWGTILGMKAALKRPDLFHAYVGMGQVINTRVNEELSFQFGLEQARLDGNEAAIAELESIAPYPGDQPITRERIIIARKWPQHYGGLNAYSDARQEYYYGASLLSPEYECADRQAFFDGSMFTLDRVLEEFLQVDFTDVREFPIPVLMFMGRHDYTTPSQPTATWLDDVDAPYKQSVWFENSAHMIPWEEPGKTLISLLRYVRPLAVEDSEM